METLTKEINDIILNEADLVHEKLRGLNFLETFKSILIEKTVPIINSYKFPLDKQIQFHTTSEKKLRTLKISINYFNTPISISRKEIDIDSLLISFNETSNLDIYEDNNINEFKSLNLYKNSGICLPMKTLINAKFSKNTFFIEIKNKDLQQPLTNVEKL